MTRALAKDLEIGMTIAGQVFLLAEWTVAHTKGGSPYVKATLQDRTGRVEARYWDVPEYVAEQLQTGSGVRVDGVVEEYPQGSGQRQIRIEHLVPVEVREPRDFVPRAKRDPAEMQRELEETVQRIENPYLSQLLDRIFSGQGFAASFAEAPAAKVYHHAYIGGLLEHSLAVVRLCSFISDEHPEIDRDMLLTAAILHDVGKARAYTTGPVLEYTDEGKLVDHIVEGAVMVQSAIEGIDGFPQELRNRLLHAILAHHGARERGSPVEPKTLEALAVHHADWLDGNIRGFLDFAQSEPISEDGWTPYSRMFGTDLYPGRPRSSDELGWEEDPPF